MFYNKEEGYFLNFFGLNFRFDCEWKRGLGIFTFMKGENLETGGNCFYGNTRVFCAYVERAYRFRA